MRHRLYWVLPDRESARRAANDLLLARVEDRRMRFLALRGTDLGELHEASILEKTDIRHGAARGILIGGVLGIALVALLWAFAPFEIGPGVAVLVAGASVLFGAWASSMVGASVPNSRLQRFSDDIAKGRILLILDLPAHRVAEIRSLLERGHPEAAWGGEDASVPAFP